MPAANVSIANQGVLDAAMRDPTIGYERGMVAGAVSLSIFTFLLLTPTGWLTLYLIGSGGVRAAAGWFDDPVGDPILTGLDDDPAGEDATGSRIGTNSCAATRAKVPRSPTASSAAPGRRFPAAIS